MEKSTSMKLRHSFFLKLFLLAFLSFNAEANTNNPNETIVKNMYYQWCSAIAKAHGDPKVMVKFYAPEAILLPTLSEEILINTDGGLDPYFKKLTSHTNIKCTTKKLITRMYKETAINSGLYTFSYTDNGKIVNIPARFTFVYQHENGAWLIVKHHSTRMPK